MLWISLVLFFEAFTTKSTSFKNERDDVINLVMKLKLEKSFDYLWTFI